MGKKKSTYKAYAIASTFVFEVLLILGGFMFLGYILTEWLNSVVFIILFSIFGVFATIYNLIRKVNKVD